MSGEQKNETTKTPAAKGPFSRTARDADSAVQERVNQELRHPPTACLSQDEPMWVYGID